MEERKSTIMHHALLSAFYDRDIQRPEAIRDPERFRFDSERRIIDLANIMWRYWPVTSTFLRAKYRDEHIFGVARQLVVNKGGTKDIESAVSHGFRSWLKELEEETMKDMFDYESIKSGHFEYALEPPPKLKEILEGQLSDFKLLNLSLDPFSFEKNVLFYSGQHAPDEFILGLEPEAHNCVLAVYKQRGKVFCNDITELFNQ